MSDLRVAQQFLDDYGNDYIFLLDQVKSACTAVQNELGVRVVDDIYTRKESTGGNDEFKEPGKIASKVRERGQVVGILAFLTLNDIVGLTVVVQYPDQMDDVISAVRKSLTTISINADEPELHEDNNGYYATHVVCSAQPNAVSIRCEIQFKTILHNAWSTKMHDLTYKPMGVLDPRHRALMESIAQTIESLERQSLLIRKMITAGWNVEEKARWLARRSLFDLVSYKQLLEQASANSTLLKLEAEIEAASDVLETGPLSHPTAIDLRNKVSAICRDPGSLRPGWMMAGRLASLRATPDLTRFFLPYAVTWLKTAEGMLTTGEIDEKEISAVPSTFYVIGDLDRAIDYSQEILDAPAFARLSPERRARIDFNRIAFLVEREYHSPTKNPGARSRLKEAIDTALKNPSLHAIDGMKSAILDTKGLATIAFADSKEQVRSRIEECLEAVKMSRPEERSIADAYQDLNQRLGWRRYFELEAREPLHVR